jgi:hypothetical protein
MFSLDKNIKKGFTLIEAILYLAIAGTVLYFISGFAFNSIFGKAKIETIQDVNQNSRSVLDEISNAISNSTEVNGATGGSDVAEDGDLCVATGGTSTTTADGYKIHTFTNSGTFRVFSDTCDVEVLVVAGGGGGGGNHGGGGGAGGLVYSSSYSLTEGNKTVTVGSGGNGNNSLSSIVGTRGGNSVFDNITALGGGYGGGYTSLTSPTTGGSGAGGTSRSGYTTGAAKTQTDSGGATGYGNRGGNAVTGQSDWPGGGGGGAGAAGSNATNDGHGGNGGIGLSYDISGTSTYYAGGGGGGGAYTIVGYAGLGGLGGGGAGGVSSTDSVAGTPNTGGGGGGQRNGGGKAGGSGIVIIKYLRN